ncbi:hypothetical protein J6590_023358 [Homalodisca vitripennis]|nr:hypothetical protein J6590_023358 [Homalodisca vitripennis]
MAVIVASDKVVSADSSRLTSGLVVCVAASTVEHQKMKREVESWFHKLQWALRYRLLVEETKNKYTAVRKKYKKLLHLAEIQANAEAIKAAPNKVKKAWEIINSSRKETVHKDTHSLSADDFNAYFISAVADIAKEVGQSLTTAMDFLSSTQDATDQFQWKTVSCEQVVEFVA